MAALYLVYLSSKAATFLSFLYKICHRTRCKFMGRRHLCFFIALCSVIEFYKRALLQAISGLLLMDCASNLKLLLIHFNNFGYGFLILGWFSKIFNIFVLLCMFFLGFLFLQLNKFRVKSLKMSEGGHVFSLMCCSNDEMKGFRRVSYEGGITKMGMGRDLGEDHCQKLVEIDGVVNSNGGVHDSVGRNGEVGEEWKECCHEDKVFDVITLRKMVMLERQRGSAAHSELEKERMAAASAVDEAMAMILRLQNEKSVLQMQVNQLQRVGEEKQLHDQEVIQSLQWIVMKHESDRSLLEDQLRMCREKLRLFMKSEEWDQFDSVCPTPSASYFSFESRADDLPIGWLDFDWSPM